MTTNCQIKHQKKITRIAIKCAELLLQHGAESFLIANTSIRIGKALGATSVEISMSSSSIVLSTLIDENCITSVRRLCDHGINMNVVTEVLKITKAAEKNKNAQNIDDIYKCINNISTKKYNKYLTIFSVAFACASFSQLFGADTAIFCVTFLASAVSMFFRQLLATKHFNPAIVFFCAAFVATSIASLATHFSIGLNPKLALASSILHLFPGFPLINAISDVLKGAINMAIARATAAAILTFSAAVGVTLALKIYGIAPWNI